MHSRCRVATALALTESPAPRHSREQEKEERRKRKAKQASKAKLSFAEDEDGDASASPNGATGGEEAEGRPQTEICESGCVGSPPHLPECIVHVAGCSTNRCATLHG